MYDGQKQVSSFLNDITDCSVSAEVPHCVHTPTAQRLVWRLGVFCADIGVDPQESQSDGGATSGRDEETDRNL